MGLAGVPVLDNQVLCGVSMERWAAKGGLPGSLRRPNNTKGVGVPDGKHCITYIFDHRSVVPHDA